MPTLVKDPDPNAKHWNTATSEDDDATAGRPVRAAGGKQANAPAPPPAAAGSSKKPR